MKNNLDNYESPKSWWRKSTLILIGIISSMGVGSYELYGLLLCNSTNKTLLDDCLSFQHAMIIPMSAVCIVVITSGSYLFWLTKGVEK